MSDHGQHPPENPISTFLGSCAGMTIGAAAPEPASAIPGLPFITPGSSSRISGPTGSGKSNVVQVGLFDAGLAGYKTLYAGFEVTRAEFDARATITDQARGGLSPTQRQTLAQHVIYADGHALFSLIDQYPKAWAHAIRGLFHIVVIDPAGDACASLGLNDEDNGDWAKFSHTVLAPIRGHAAAIVLDNVGWSDDARKRSRGASQKENGADIVLYSTIQKEPAALVLTCSKVRSMVAPFSKGDKWIAYKDDGQAAHPHDADDATVKPAWRPTIVMENVSRAIEAQPGIGLRNLRAVVGGNKDVFTKAIARLVEEDYVRIEEAGQAHHHHSVKPFRKDEDPHRGPVAEPWPDRGPATGVGTVAPWPPLKDTGHGPHPHKDAA